MPADQLHIPPFSPFVLAKNLQPGGQSAAIVYEDRIVTRSQLRDEISRYIAAFAELGIGKGARIAFISRNRPELIYLTSAALMSNLCLVPLHVLGSQEDFAYICNDAEVEILFFEDGFTNLAKELVNRCSALRAFSLGVESQGEFHDIQAIAASHEPHPLNPVPVCGTDVCRLSYTGGTTYRITHKS